MADCYSLTSVNQFIAVKADKVTSPILDDIAILHTDGNIYDSGVNISQLVLNGFADGGTF